MKTTRTHLLWTGVLLACMAYSSGSEAEPIPGQGTWETTLLPRDLDRNGVVDAFYDTDLGATWLRATNIDPLKGLPGAHLVTWGIADALGQQLLVRRLF